MVNNKTLGKNYLEQELMTLNPVQLLIKAYDAGIAACNRKDEERAGRVLAELIDSLNFDEAEMSNSLFRLYEYCVRDVKKGNFDVTLKILKELRETWVQVQNCMPKERLQAGVS